MNPGSRDPRASSRRGNTRANSDGPDRRRAFSAREVDVLRLVAEGYGTDEIARMLAYSERTVKNVIHDVTSRLGLRNRCHTVAYAVRAGII